MGSLISEGYVIYPTAPTDAGTELDDDGNYINPKVLLDVGLVKQFDLTKGIYMRMDEDQKARFMNLTNIDEQDFDENNVNAG